MLLYGEDVNLVWQSCSGLENVKIWKKMLKSLTNFLAVRMQWVKNRVLRSSLGHFEGDSASSQICTGPWSCRRTCPARPWRGRRAWWARRRPRGRSWGPSGGGGTTARSGGGRSGQRAAPRAPGCPRQVWMCVCVYVRLRWKLNMKKCSQK